SGQPFVTGVWGNTYQTSWQNPGQQDPGQQNQPQNMMTDYSKAWEDYYKKQSMTPECVKDLTNKWSKIQSSHRILDQGVQSPQNQRTQGPRTIDRKID
ncbi:hypothetical protein AMECASPLE_039028, partial [Ameca splendens]